MSQQAPIADPSLADGSIRKTKRTPMLVTSGPREVLRQAAEPMTANDSRGIQSPDRQTTNRLRTDGSGQITPPDSELLGEDRLPMTQGCTRVESALMHYWPDRGDGDVSLGLGYGYDAGTGRSGVHLGLDYETDDVETAVYGSLSPQQARELAVALEHFADAVEAER